MQGKSADFAKYALPSLRKQRILITFTKSQLQRPIQIDSQHHLPSAAIVQASHRAPTPNKPLNHIPKYFGSVPSNNVMPAPPIIPAINGMQPLLVAAPSMPFPAPVPIPAASTTGWVATPPLQQPPHPNVPGTGVFLPPPGSGSPSPSDQPPPCSTAEQNPDAEERGGSDKEDGLEKSSQGNPECNGDVEGRKTVVNERTWGWSKPFKEVLRGWDSKSRRLPEPVEVEANIKSCNRQLEASHE